MAEQVDNAKPVVSFEYELFEGDPDNLRTVVATPTPAGPWIDPRSVKPKYRIGRGPFGDVRLATHHQSSDDFDKYHELALKVLHPLEKDHTQKFLDRFEELFFRCRGFRNVCWLHGISIIDGKICIAMKVYEGSVGDKVAQIKGGKLQLSQSLRYGIGLVKGVMELHSIGMMVLNLKPSNILLNENNEAVLGDFGIPYLLLGVPLSSSDMVLRLGTTNYMAPEQWEPEVRGPISLETDSWGFGCCFVEMLTGSQPWNGKPIEEIYHSVVVKKEKPQTPSGLPPAVESVINGCFEYDLRNRPLPVDILNAFESSQNSLHNEGGEWFGSRPSSLATRSSHSTWYLSKDQIRVGDMVRSRKPPNARKPQTIDVPEGTVVSLERGSGKDGFALVKIPGVRSPARVLVSTVERVTAGFSAGDWVRLKERNSSATKHSSVGIIHTVDRDGAVAIGFIGLETLWRGHLSEVQVASSYYVRQFVKVKETVRSPRFAWPRKDGGRSWAPGKVMEVLPNGCLVVGFPGRLESSGSLVDPAEAELVSFDTCPGLVEKYLHVEDFHWAVRPLTVAAGLLMAVKFGFLVGRAVGPRIKKGHRARRDEGCQEGQSGNWLPPPVANLFKDGGGGGGGGGGSSTATFHR